MNVRLRRNEFIQTNSCLNSTLWLWGQGDSQKQWSIGRGGKTRQIGKEEGRGQSVVDLSRVEIMPPTELRITAPPLEL